MTKIRVGYAARAIGTAPVWTGVDAGYFRNYGLEVEPVLFKGSLLVTKALEAGEIELANYAAPAAVHANLERQANLVVVLGAMNRMMQSLMGRPGISSFQDLRGGTIGVNEWGEVNHWLVEALLPHIGFVAGRDVTLIETGRSQGETWETPKQADAIILHPPEPYAALKHGWSQLVDLRDLNIPFQISSVSAQREWSARHREELKLYLLGHVEGILRFNTDRDFALHIARKWGTPVDEEVLAQTWEFASKEFSEHPFPTVQAIQGILNAMKGQIACAAVSNPADHIDASFLQELEESGQLKDLRIKYGRLT
jgi:ABC-type nitrate/sulfonate/bicarbonate transport system substrate-binding protein